MKVYRNVIVGVDFSGASKAAAEEAARIASWGDGVLHVVHVLTADEVEDAQAYAIIPTDQIIAGVKEKLQAFMSDSPAGHPRVEFHVSIGHPFNDLVSYCDENDGDLIVLGSHGEGGRPGRVGVIASRSVRKAEVPVMLVRGRQREPFRKVVACVDFSATSKKALIQAGAIAEQDEAELHVVHVSYPLWMKPTSVLYDLHQVPDEEQQRAERERLKEELEEFVAEALGSGRSAGCIKVPLEKQYAAYAMADYLREENADLAVLGTRGRSGMKAFLLGTTAERLIHESPCSVLVVKPDQDGA
ncbi:MAG: universal stress protein [Verrucomicrobiales bacterium]|nr:universal stress protein [Verrucomicrobiales bacterium]